MSPMRPTIWKAPKGGFWALLGQISQERKTGYVVNLANACVNRGSEWWA